MPMLEITEEQLTEWMALCDAATPGPWHCGKSGAISGCEVRMGRNGEPEQCEVHVADSGQTDGAFIAAARTAMPALIAALREARAKHDRLLGGFGDLQELLNALAVEQAKVTRLREALERCQPRLLARWFDADDARKGRFRLHGNDVQEALEEAARVLKETHDL